MNHDQYELEVENSFVLFLLTLQKLCLSKKVTKLVFSSNIDFGGFLPRNRRWMKKPKGILIL